MKITGTSAHGREMSRVDGKRCGERRKRGEMRLAIEREEERREAEIEAAHAAYADEGHGVTIRENITRERF